MRRLLCLLAAAVCAAGPAWALMGRQEYQAQRTRIQDKYATDKDRCSSLRDHPRRICEAQAWADYDTARTELRARYKPSARTAERARVSRADAQYRVARTRCGDLRGGAHELCLEEAKNRWKAQRSEAREHPQASTLGNR